MLVVASKALWHLELLDFGNELEQTRGDSCLASKNSVVSHSGLQTNMCFMVRGMCTVNIYGLHPGFTKFTKNHPVKICPIFVGTYEVCLT